MICTTHNLLNFSPSQRPPQAATVQQMPGRDAYLDGLLVFATRAHARGGIVTRPKQTLESRSSRARTLAPDVKPCRETTCPCAGSVCQTQAFSKLLCVKQRTVSYSPMGRIATTMKDRDARYYKLLDLVTLATDR